VLGLVWQGTLMILIYRLQHGVWNSLLFFTCMQYIKGKDKGKAVPLQAWSIPEYSRNLSFPDIMTTAQDGGLSALRTGRLLPPGNTPGTHFC
jgi:hypothetical protein